MAMRAKHLVVNPLGGHRVCAHEQLPQVGLMTGEARFGL